MSKNRTINNSSVFTIFIFLLLPALLYAQAPPFSWAINPKGLDNDWAIDMATGPDGTVYVLGGFGSDSLEFGDTTLYASISGAKYFVAKYDSLGNFINVKAFYHGGSSWVTVNGIHVDENSNLYMVGAYEGSVLVAPGYTLPPTPNNLTYAYIIKFDSLGQVIWARFEQTNNPPENSIFQKVRTDSFGNVYATGTYTTDSVVFDSYVVHNHNTQYSVDIFIVKYDSAGTVLWAKGCGGVNTDELMGINVDHSGNLIVCGTFNYGDMWFDNYQLIISGVSDLFIAKYDPAGNVLWVQDTPDMGGEEADDVGTDAAGNIYVAGTYNGTFNLDTVEIPYTASGIQAFISKFDSNGNCIWAKCPEGNDQDHGFKIFVHPSGNSVMSGIFNSDSLVFPTAVLPGDWAFDMYLAAYDDAGTFLWAQQAGTQGEYEDFTDMAVDSYGKIYISGTFDAASISFGNILLNNSDTLFPEEDIFLAGLGPVNIFSGLEQIMRTNVSFNIYPNPASAYLMISFSDIPHSLELIMTDISGKEILRKKAEDTQLVELNISSLSPGIYLLQLQNSEFTEWRKVIVGN